MAVTIMQHTNEQDKIAQMEKKLEAREDAFQFHLELSQEKKKFDDKMKELKKRYNKSNYGVLFFIFTMSLISVIMYRHLNYNKIEKKLQMNYPYIYDKINQINYDIDSYNTFEFALIVTVYHYIVYKMISNRFIVMVASVTCSLYYVIKLID